jgi:outer membrane protein assembly factor BamB
MTKLRYILVGLVAAGLLAALWLLAQPRNPEEKPGHVNASLPAPKEPKYKPFTAPATGSIKLALGATPWPMYRGNPAMTGVAPGRIGNSLRLAWVMRTGESLRNGSGHSSAVIGHGLAYIGSEDGNLYALELATGRKAWAFPSGDIIQAPPMLLDDTVIFGGNRKVVCLGALDGKVRWTSDIGDDVAASANWFAGPSGDKRIVIGCWDYNVYCLDFKNGHSLWKQKTGSYVNAAATVAAGRIVQAACDGNVYWLDPQSGDVQRKFETENFIASAAAMESGKLYFGSYSQKFYCLDAATGHADWTFAVDGEIDAGAAVAPDRVVFGARDHCMYCLDPLGRKLWEFRGRDSFMAAPVICGDRVLAPCDDGWLYLLDLATGHEVWSFELGESIESSPAVGGGFVVLGCDDGNVYGFAVEK